MTIHYKFRDLLADWQKEAIELLGKKFRELLRSSDFVLADFAEKAENARIRGHFFEAQREIWVKMEDLSLDFTDLLTKKLREFPAEQEQHSPQFWDGTLSLVNIDLYERNLVLQTMADRAQRDNMHELYPLAKRLAVINYGQPVSLEQIPASPHQLCDLFSRCVNRLTIEKDALLVLYTLFDKHVLSALPQLYAHLNQILINAGILPTFKYEVRPIGWRRKSGILADDDHPTTRAQLAEETMKRIHELLRANRSRKRKKVPLPTKAHSATSRELVEAVNAALQQHDLFDSSQLLDSSAGSDAVKRAQAAMLEQRKTIKQQVGENRLIDDQEDIIDLVGLLFEEMLDDNTIPNAAKALLGYLYTPYIKIALSDGDFFSNPEHPARLFLEKAIAASAIWVDESNLEEGIYPFLKKTVYNIVRMRKQSRDDFKGYLETLGEEVSLREHKFQLVEKRKVEAEISKEQLLKTKEKARRVTAELFGGKPIPVYCEKFIKELWVDYLTLLQLRDQGDEHAQQWREAMALGRRIREIIFSRESGPERSTRVDSLSRHLSRQIGLLLPHHERKLKDFVEALRNPPAAGTTLTFTLDKKKAEDASPDDKKEKPNQQNSELYQQLRQLPKGTWFEFNAGSAESYRARLSWYNPMTDHFLFMTPRQRKSIVLDIDKLAEDVLNGSVVYFTDIKRSFWNRAMTHIHSFLEEKLNDSKTPEQQSET